MIYYRGNTSMSVNCGREHRARAPAERYQGATGKQFHAELRDMACNAASGCSRAGRDREGRQQRPSHFSVEVVDLPFHGAHLPTQGLNLPMCVGSVRAARRKVGYSEGGSCSCWFRCICMASITPLAQPVRTNERSQKQGKIYGFFVVLP